jgi:hypothetical protein
MEIGVLSHLAQINAAMGGKHRFFITKSERENLLKERGFRKGRALKQKSKK